MKKNTVRNAGFAGVLAVISAIVVMYAWVPFLLKLLADVFAYHLPFWSAFGYNLIMFLLTEVVAIVCAILFGGLAAINLKRVNK